MSTFMVNVEREVAIIERSSFTVDADTQEEADILGGEVVASLNDGKTNKELTWQEDVDEARIEPMKVTKVTLHAFDDADAKEPE